MKFSLHPSSVLLPVLPSFRPGNVLGSGERTKDGDPQNGGSSLTVREIFLDITASQKSIHGIQPPVLVFVSRKPFVKPSKPVLISLCVE